MMKRYVLLLLILLFWISGFVYAQPMMVGTGSASETVTGSVELATDAETVTGTATDKVTTPGNITAKMAAPGAIGGTTPAAGTFSGLNVGKSDGTAGGNANINATLGSELITWTDAGWNEDGVTWTFAGGVLTHVTGNTTAVTGTVTGDLTVGGTYAVRFVGTGGGGTATYTLGGVTGTTIAASGAIDFTDYITVSSNSELVITPASGCTVALTLVSVKLLTNNTGDLTVDGNAIFRSPVVFPTGTLANPGFKFLPQNSNAGMYVGSYGPTIENSGADSGTFYQGIVIRSDHSYGFASSTATNATPDTKIVRDAANTLGLRNSTSQQKFNVYNTAASATADYERSAFTGVQGNSVNWTAETNGAGADNIDCVITPAGTGKVSTPANFYTSGDCSALTFTDRTPFYEGDALAALKPIAGKDGKIDHNTLPDFAKRTVKHTVVNSCKEEEVQITSEEALEEVAVDVQMIEDKPITYVDKEGKTVHTVKKEPVVDRTETEYQLINGVATPTEKLIYKTKKETQKKLKDGIRLDAKTGNFYKKVTTVDKAEIEEPGRDLGAMISILVKANQQLLERVEKLEAEKLP